MRAKVPKKPKPKPKPKPFYFSLSRLIFRFFFPPYICIAQVNRRHIYYIGVWVKVGLELNEFSQTASINYGASFWRSGKYERF